ncbi:hypothetical protein JW921_00710 [Candidatus Fermentibacterales bacterium]|nr:hypothetical protein [Candidatus Fermentibacterales bacterium]
MSTRISACLVISLSVAACSCGSRSEASAAVVSFAEALADSDYVTAWELLTPASQERYEAAADVLLEFGWIEAGPVLAGAAPSITEQMFGQLDGFMLFEATVSAAPQSFELSTSVKSVSYPDSGLAVVVLRTGDGLQEVEARRAADGQGWLVDLSTLEPPLQEAPGE